MLLDRERDLDVELEGDRRLLDHGLAILDPERRAVERLPIGGLEPLGIGDRGKVVEAEAPGPSPGARARIRRRIWPPYRSPI